MDNNPDISNSHSYHHKLATEIFASGDDKFEAESKAWWDFESINPSLLNCRIGSIQDHSKNAHKFPFNTNDEIFNASVFPTLTNSDLVELYEPLPQFSGVASYMGDWASFRASQQHCAAYLLKDGPVAYSDIADISGSTRSLGTAGETEVGDSGFDDQPVRKRARTSPSTTKKKAPTPTTADLQTLHYPRAQSLILKYDRFAPSSNSGFSNSSASSCGTFSSLSSDEFHYSSIASMPHSPVAIPTTGKPRKRHKAIAGNAGLEKLKIFGCTWRGCHKKFSLQRDWKLHEESIHCPQVTWMCPITSPPTKYGQVICGREYQRKDKFRAHLESSHGFDRLRSNRALADYLLPTHLSSPFSKDCGFCGEYLPTWKYRMYHIANEYTENGKDITMWADSQPHRSEFGYEHNNCDNDGNDVDTGIKIVKPDEDGNAKVTDVDDEDSNSSCEKLPSHPRSSRPSPASNFSTKVGSTLGKASPYSVQSQDDGSDSSFENEMDWSDDDCDSISSSSQSPLKLYLGGPTQRLIIEILGTFWELYNKEWPSIVSHCIVLVAAGETSGSNCCTTGNSGSVPSASAGTKSSTFAKLSGKRRTSEDNSLPEGSGDGPLPPNGRVPLMSKPITSYACPFRKHNPRKYNIYHHMSCALGSFGSIARVKEHLYRRHMAPIQCVRCWLFFKDQDKLNIHLSVTNVCECRDGQLAEGITATMEKRLRSRKKTSVEQTDQDRWKDIYRMLFPDEDVPSPLYEPVQDDATQSSEPPDITIEEFMRQSVPENFTNRLQSEVNNWDLEETGLQDNPARLRETFITRITSLISEAQDAAIQTYRQRYSRSSSQSNQLMTPAPSSSSASYRAPGQDSRRVSHQSGGHTQLIVPSWSQGSQSRHATPLQPNPNVDQEYPYSKTEQTILDLHGDGNYSMSPNLMNENIRNSDDDTFDSRQEQRVDINLLSGIQTFQRHPSLRENDSSMAWYPGYDLTPWIDIDGQVNPPT